MILFFLESSFSEHISIHRERIKQTFYIFMNERVHEEVFCLDSIYEGLWGGGRKNIYLQRIAKHQNNVIQDMRGYENSRCVAQKHHIRNITMIISGTTL